MAVGCSNAPNESAGGVPPVASESEEATPDPSLSFDLDAYKEKVASCTEQIYKQALILGNLANHELSYASALQNLGGTFNSEDAFSGAVEWLTEQVEKGSAPESFANVNETTLKIADDEISEEYADISATNVEGSAGEDIHDQITALYNSYVTLYSAVTAPSVTSLSSAMTDDFSTIQKSAEILATLSGAVLPDDA